MKKILYLAFMCVCVAFIGRVHAQGPMSASQTTLTNADTSYLTATPGGGKFVSLQLNITKVSGTVAGSVLVQSSNDASSWYTSTDTAHAVIGAYTITDGNQSKFWELGEQRSRYYRLRVITTGTQVSTVNGFFWVNK